MPWHLLGAATGLGWVVHDPHVPLHGSRIAYYVDASFCRTALPHFHEDSLLSWQRFGCVDLRTMLRKAFDVGAQLAHLLRGDDGARRPDHRRRPGDGRP